MKKLLSLILPLILSFTGAFAQTVKTDTELTNKVTSDIKPGLTPARTATVFNQLIDSKASKLLPANVRTTDYTFAMSDIGKRVESNSASAIVFTIPDNATVSFPIDATWVVSRYGAGTLTIDAMPGVTMHSASGTFDISQQYQFAVITKKGTNEFLIQNGVGSLLDGEMTRDIHFSNTGHDYDFKIGENSGDGPQNVFIAGHTDVRLVAVTGEAWFNFGGFGSGLTFGPSGMIVSDNDLSIGLEYFSDYSANYTNRSLVDAEYAVGKKINVNYYEQEDFLGGASAVNGTGTGFIATNTGTSAAVSYSSTGVNTTENCIGVIRLDTGTDTNGTSRLHKGTASLLFGIAEINWQARLTIDAVSDGTNTYTARVGFGDASTGEDTDGVYFRYTHGTNSGKWQGVCRSNGTESTVDIGVGPTATVNQIFQIIVNEAGTSALFKIIDDSGGTFSPAAVTTNIPTGSGRQCGPGFRITKTAGTTSRTVFVDWYSLGVKKSSAR